MLYFSESSPTLPDIMEMNEAFDRDYDRAEYENKIARLIVKLRQRFRKADKKCLETWLDATRTLKKEDCHLLVMVEQCFRAPRGFSRLACLLQ
jgi:hypothetical protein